MHCKCSQQRQLLTTLGLYGFPRGKPSVNEHWHEERKDVCPWWTGNAFWRLWSCRQSSLQLSDSVWSLSCLVSRVSAMALYNIHDHWPTSLCLNNCRGARGTYKVNWSQVQQINKRSFDWQGREGLGFPEIPCSESLSWGPAITWSGLGLTDFLGEELILSFAMSRGLSSSCWLFMKMIYFISTFTASSHPRFLSLPRLGLSGIILQSFIE